MKERMERKKKERKVTLMLTDTFCEISHRQNTNPASSHHIAPLDAARV